MLTFAAAVFFLIVTPGPGVLSTAGVGSGYGYRPGLEYAWLGLRSELELPSPKSQWNDVGRPVERLRKETVSFTSTEELEGAKCDVGWPGASKPSPLISRI